MIGDKSVRSMTECRGGLIATGVCHIDHDVPMAP
jgi:hypothetical protein